MMPVYLDQAYVRYPTRDVPGHREPKMVCHLTADTRHELHGMADRLGVPREHFRAREGFPHYRLGRSKIRKARKFGLRQMDQRAFWEKVEQIIGSGHWLWMDGEWI